jgi:glyoxylase-like metal-dependent hydrolase (beta-lactamase superfamily II)
MTRREWLRSTGALAAYGIALRCAPAVLAAQAKTDLASRRAQMGAVPIEMTKVTGWLNLLSGPGGNVLVVHGADGKVVVDSFVQPAWPKLSAILDGLGRTPIKGLINTHWHFEHTDNNANFRAAGATVIAHNNTAKRLVEPHELAGMRIPPVPAAALPTLTFAKTQQVTLNGEHLALSYVPPAHTDTDIFVQCEKANVFQMGDIFINGAYPYIDAGTGGHINGMIAAVELALEMTNVRTRFVPGHGPLGDRATLIRYRDMLAAVRDRVQKLKSAGRSLADVQAAKPTADYDAAFGKGTVPPSDFVALVYGTL